MTLVPSLALVILDGWGLAPPGPGNAISQAETPVFDELWAAYPHTTLTASGRAVGLPDGQMGNSEVGHLNLVGLVSDGGVHSGWEHIEACIELAAQEGVPDLVLHALTDGRDTLPHGGKGYLEELERWLRQAGRVGTV